MDIIHFCDACGKGVDNPYHSATMLNNNIRICKVCVGEPLWGKFLEALGRLRDPMVDTGLQPQLGKVYMRTDGVLTGPLQAGGSGRFPFKDPRSGIEYTVCGTTWRCYESYLDLVMEYEPESA